MALKPFFKLDFRKKKPQNFFLKILWEPGLQLVYSKEYFKLNKKAQTTDKVKNITFENQKPQMKSD